MGFCLLCLIQGVVRHLKRTLWEMEVYISDLEKVMHCYVQRLQWLLSGEPACCLGDGGPEEQKG
jgi:hypothetical protein